MYKLYTSSYVYCYLVFYALESAVRPLGERRYTKQPLLLLYYQHLSSENSLEIPEPE